MQFDITIKISEHEILQRSTFYVFAAFAVMFPN